MYYVHAEPSYLPLNPMKTKAHSLKSRAFSLVELLVVIAVIAIVAGYAVPAVTSMLKGSQLTQGSQMVVDQIALARQTALSRNRSVEVRFYKYADPETPGEDQKKSDTWLMHGIQVFEILDNGAALPLGAVQRLPTNVIIHQGKLSSLIDGRTTSADKFTKPTDSDPGIPGMDAGVNVKEQYVYAGFRFLPDGSTDLPPTGTVTQPTGDSWYITLVNPKDAGATALGVKAGEAANYFTLQIDPVTGSTRSYRPNVGG